MSSNATCSWVHGGDVDRHLVGELLEVVVERHEVGFALHLDQDADPLLLALTGSAHVRVRRDDALRGAPATALRGRGLTLLAEDLDRLLLVALGLLQRVLDVDDRGAGALPQGLHVGGCNRHQDSPPLWVGAGSGVASASSTGGGCGTSMAASRLASSSEPCASCGACSPSGCGWGISSPASRSASACLVAACCCCCCCSCCFCSASARAFASASAFAFSSASCLAFSSASRRWRSSSSRRFRSSSSARRRASSSRHLAAAPSIGGAQRADDQLTGADRVVVAGDDVADRGPGRNWCRPAR